MNQRPVQMLDYFKISLLQNAIHNHIRLFEPLVIKALKQYTTTTSVQLQRQVLDLLAQLVQLRVNYCLLDSDQVGTSPHLQIVIQGSHQQAQWTLAAKILVTVHLVYNKWKQRLKGRWDSISTSPPPATNSFRLLGFFACKWFSELCNNYLRTAHEIDFTNKKMWTIQTVLLNKTSFANGNTFFHTEGMDFLMTDNEHHGWQLLFDVNGNEGS